MRQAARSKRTANDNVAASKAEAHVEMKRKYARVYETEDGRKVLDDIINQHCRFDDFTFNPVNPIETYGNAARRDVGLAIRKMIHEKVTDGNAN